MKICLSNKADIFASIFQNVKNFTDHINIDFNSERMYFQTMDTSHVSIVELTIPSGWFDSYDCVESCHIGISAGIVGKILSLKDKSHILELEVKDDRLLIHFLNKPDMSSISGGGGTAASSVSSTNSIVPETKPNTASLSVFEKHFEIPLIDIDSEYMSIPEIEYQAEFSLSSVYFADMMSQLKIFGDTMEIECSEDSIVLYSKSQDNGKMSVDIKIDNLTSFEIEEAASLKLSYSLNYLHHICAFHRLSKYVEVKLCNEYPLQISYKLGKDAVLALYLAPKMEDS
jgi:proliferating cell nuclear antigen